MTAYEQLLSLTNVLNASELKALLEELAYYESGREMLTEPANRTVNACFVLIKSLREEEKSASFNEHEIALEKRASRSEAGKRGAEKRWGRKLENPEDEMANNSKDSKDSNATNAILGHSEPFSPQEEVPTPFSSSPTPPSSQTTPEEETDPLKETLSNESIKKKSPTIEERRIAFGKSLEQYTGDGPGQFPRGMVAAFYRYWTEASPGGVKMLWEKQKTFDPKLRLENWQRREAEKQQQQQKNNGGYKQTNRTIKDDFSDCVYESTIQI